MKQMTSTYPKLTTILALAMLVVSAGFLVSGQPMSEDNFPQPKMVIMDKSLSADQAQKSVHAARLFYAFWNTGDPQFAKLALATNFIDRTLPKGRPQGVDGLLFASRNFRQAVPDLRCDVEQLIVAGDRVVAHLHFLGHFNGAFGQKQGAGQIVDFIATDILRVQDGRIMDNWHIEDNLTLMQQLGIVQP
jgi:predicted ester cyclase